MFYVYIFQHKQNHKIYVGKTNDLNYRLAKHKQSAKCPKTYFHKALAKYGIKSFNYFSIEVWEDEKECLDAEKFWIEFFQSNHKNYGYNLTEGGDGSSGYKHTPETIAKLKIVNKTKTLGKKHSAESKRKMSLSRLAMSEQNSLMNSGENNPNAKIKESTIQEMVELLSRNELTIAEIASKFSISKSQVQKIRRGESWGKVHTTDRTIPIYKNDGERNPRAKLTQEKVKEMRELYAKGYGLSQLCELFAVSKPTVWQIVNYLRWKNVP